MQKTIKEWAVIFGIMSLLYITGLHAEVAGFLQRIVLYTGILQPEMIEGASQKEAAYDFKMVNSNGQLIDFSKFRGQTIFINFWATWCPPCIAEMPDIQDLYNEVGHKDVAFVMISQDNDFEKAKSFVNRKGYTFPIFQLASSLPTVYASRSIPTTFVISPDGEIIVKQIGMAKYNTESFRSLLTTEAPQNLLPL